MNGTMWDVCAVCPVVGTIWHLGALMKLYGRFFTSVSNSVLLTSHTLDLECIITRCVLSGCTT